jgi:hypothetical protein
LHFVHREFLQRLSQGGGRKTGHCVAYDSRHLAVERKRGEFSVINMSNWFLRLAVLYLIAGVGLGLYMAASNDHTMFAVHAHLNLLGWVTLALFGLFYRVVPAATGTTLAKVQFWIYVPAHFVQMVLLALFFRGVVAIEPALGAVSMVVGIAVVMFGVVVWKHTPALQERGPLSALRP